MSEIKAVVFDLDGVYFEGGTERFMKSLSQKYGLTEEQIKAVYLRSDSMQMYKKGEISSENFWEYALDSWGIEATREDIVGLLISSYEVNPVTEKLVDGLRTKGIKTAICTNNFPDRFENLAKKFELRKHFDVIITSYEEKVTKPSAEIFKILSEKLMLPPENILMSDDREANVDALKSLGFQAFLYEGLEHFMQQVEHLL